MLSPSLEGFYIYDCTAAMFVLAVVSLLWLLLFNLRCRCVVYWFIVVLWVCWCRVVVVMYVVAVYCCYTLPLLGMIVNEHDWSCRSAYSHSPDDGHQPWLLAWEFFV